jgi:hypothetical protein
MNWKRCGRKRSRRNSTYCSSILIEGLRNTSENLSEDSRFLESRFEARSSQIRSKSATNFTVTFRQRCNWVNNIKIDVREKGCDDINLDATSSRENSVGGLCKQVTNMKQSIQCLKVAIEIGFGIPVVVLLSDFCCNWSKVNVKLSLCLIN